MNPFKVKTLDEFTVEDCQSYLASYPYGDNAYDVKQHLEKLQKGSAKPKQNNTNKPQAQDAPVTNSSVDLSAGSQRRKEPKPEPEQTTHRGSNVEQQSSNDTSASGTFDKVLTIAGWIVAVIVVIAIIFAIMPEGAGDFLSKYWYGIGVLVICIAKILDRT